jgi:hypothetical protein
VQKHVVRRDSDGKAAAAAAAAAGREPIEQHAIMQRELRHGDLLCMIMDPCLLVRFRAMLSFFGEKSS